VACRGAADLRPGAREPQRDHAADAEPGVRRGVRGPRWLRLVARAADDSRRRAARRGAGARRLSQRMSYPAGRRAGRPGACARRSGHAASVLGALRVLRCPLDADLHRRGVPVRCLARRAGLGWCGGAHPARRVDSRWPRAVSGRGGDRELAIGSVGACRLPAARSAARGRRATARPDAAAAPARRDRRRATVGGGTRRAAPALPILLRPHSSPNPSRPSTSRSRSRPDRLSGPCTRAVVCFVQPVSAIFCDAWNARIVGS